MKADRMGTKTLAKFVALVLAIFLYPPTLAQSDDDYLIIPAVEVNTVADSPGEVWVSRNSSYCNWEQSMGPICVYNDTNQVVIVPAGLTLPSGKLEVEIHNAKTVHVYPTCVSWIQVFSAGLITTMPSEQDFFTLYHKRCRTWLRIYNSRADTISHGVKDLTIINTQVNTINLVQQRDFMAINSTIKSIESLNWEGYRGTIQNTTIQRIHQIVAKDNWLIIGSHFGYITTDGIVFNAKEMAVTNSSISHIAPHGVKIFNGAASFTNVTIDMLEASAIMVKSPNAFLVLNNVTIGSAFANCIVLLDKERISITNVTIKGVPLTMDSPYLKYVDNYVPPVNTSMVQVEKTREGCTSTPTTLTCDFNSVNDSIELSAANIAGYRVVQIRNVKSLQVLSTSCDFELQLKSVNGTLPHFATDTNQTAGTADNPAEAHQKDETECRMSLTVTDSRLDVISSRYITNLTVTNSTVKRLHDGSLEGFHVKNVTINTIDSINITHSGSKWEGLVVGSIFNVTIQAPVKAEGVLVTQRLRKAALIIDHEEATTVLSKVKFSTLERESIVVKNGKLVLKDFVAIAINEGAIYVEKGATIELDNVVSFLASYRTVSVATRDQVLLNGTANPHTGRMIHVRNPLPPPNTDSNLTISAVHLSPYCTPVPFFLKVCDFSHLPNASVVIDLSNDQSHRAVVRGAYFVTLYPSCLEKLILLKVTKATTVDNEKDCDTWLEAKGVQFQNITAGVHDVTLTSCTVDYLAPNRKLRDLDLEDTNVKWLAGVQWSGYTGLFNNSHLGKVEGLVASSRMVMSNTTIENLLPEGIKVMTEGVITNSSIIDIASRGIIVKGMLRMRDVTIGKLAKKAIVVTEGLLLLSNVSIGSAEELSIIADMNGGVAMQNVTVGGKKVHWRGYLAESLGPDDSSLVFVNKHVDEDHKSIPSIPVVIPPEEPSRSTPQSSSMTQSFAPDDNLGSITGSSKRMDASEFDSPSSSWKWAGAGIGAFLVILIGSCIFLTVKLVKPNNGRLMPIVFWRVKDDQNDLLAEDEGSGYHIVPGTEVI